MFKKFEDFMTKHLMPLANKVDKQRHLSAIKQSMVAMIPVLILGSLFAIVPAIPSFFSSDNFLTNFINNNAALLDLPVTLSLGFIGFFVTLSIAYFLGNTYKLYIPGCILLSGVAFLLLTVVTNEDGSLIISNLGSKGMFTGMIVAVVSVELYRVCTEKKFTIKMPEGVPDFVSRSFELIPTTMIVIGTFIITRGLFLSWFDKLPPEILTGILSPLVGSMDNPWSIVSLNFVICVIFFFGIHSSVFSPITRPIMVQFLAENIQAYQSGEAIPHIYTAGASSAFFGFTGCGITMGLVVCCMISKVKRYRKIGQISFLPSLFGINEPILFGAPIILNPMFFIPFVLGGTFIGSFPYFLMHYNIINRPVFDPPYIGVFGEGFLATLDWRVYIVHIVQLILAVALYYPFFKVVEKREIEEEKKAKDELNNKEIFTSQEKEILEELDLDF